MIKGFTLLLAAAILITATPSQAQIMLRPSVTVTGNVIHLGDLFANAGLAADDTIAAAPALGMRATYSSAWLAAVAREHGLDWAPASEFNQSVVERASRLIGADAIAQRLLQNLAPNVQGADAEIRFDSSSLRLFVPAEAQDDIAIDGLNFDQRTGRFSAFVSAPAGATDAQRLRVTGRLVVEIEIPVPNRAVAINEILSARDVERIKLSRERISSDTLTDPAQLIGKAARHALRAEQPLRTGDVQEPLVIHKGDLVTIELRTATMQLATQGKALEDAAIGATVRVTNTQSNRTIDTIAAGQNLVRAVSSDKVAVR